MYCCSHMLVMNILDGIERCIIFCIMSKLIINRRAQSPFPFLRLPAEIRNEIYRPVLLTQNIVIYKPNFDYDLRVLGEDADGLGYAERGEVAVGTIRCESWRSYRIRYQIDFLLTNRQIYREAWAIFQLENI